MEIEQWPRCYDRKWTGVIPDTSDYPANVAIFAFREKQEPITFREETVEKITLREETMEKITLESVIRAGHRGKPRECPSCKAHRAVDLIRKLIPPYLDEIESAAVNAAIENLDAYHNEVIEDVEQMSGIIYAVADLLGIENVKIGDSYGKIAAKIKALQVLVEEWS